MNLCRLLQDKVAFIFDLDGTLIDSVEAHISSWIIAFKRALKINVGEDNLRELIGLSGIDIVRRIASYKGLNKYKKIRWIKDRAFLSSIKSGRVTLFPGSLKILRLLKSADIKTCIATSTPTYMAIHILEYFDLFKYVDLLVSGDEVRRSKPAPDIFEKGIRSLNTSPELTVIVGDTFYDALPALELGALPVVIKGDSTEETFKNVKTSTRNRLVFLEDLVNLAELVRECYKNRKY